MSKGRAQANKFKGGQIGKRIIDWRGGQINYSSLTSLNFLSFLPVDPSSQSRTLEGPFELTRGLSRTLNLAL